jgi:hypothetical protein
MKERKKTSSPYLRIILIYILFSALFYAAYMTGIMTADSLKAFLAGLSLNLINALIAFPLMKKGMKGSNKEFLIFSLGGMSARIMFLLIVIFVIIKFMNINLIEFLIGFFVFYFAFLIWEVYYYNLRSIKKEKT